MGELGIYSFIDLFTVLALRYLKYSQFNTRGFAS